MDSLLKPGASGQRSAARSTRQQQVSPSSPYVVVRRGRATCSSVMNYYSGGGSDSSSVIAKTPVAIIEKAEELMLPLPTCVESAADDPELHNPLIRAQRLSTSWFGVTVELEGVVIQNSEEEHTKAWLQVAEEYGYKRPFGQQLRRIKGVRDEVVVSRIFGWTHNPSVARQVAQRKGELYDQLLEGRQHVAMLEARPFLDMLKRNSIPVALVSPLPDRKVQDILQRVGLLDCFDAVVTADDAGLAEVELYYAYAAQRMQRPPLRCIVIGESNCSVEASFELGMKCIVVTGNKPVYDFGSADLIVRNLSQINFMNLRKLFGNEQLREPRMTLEDLEASNVGEDGYAVSTPESDSLASSHGKERKVGVSASGGFGAFSSSIAESNDPFANVDDEFEHEDDDDELFGRGNMFSARMSSPTPGLHDSLAFRR